MGKNKETPLPLIAPRFDGFFDFNQICVNMQQSLVGRCIWPLFFAPAVFGATATGRVVAVVRVIRLRWAPGRKINMIIPIQVVSIWIKYRA